jgi:hypothetical protein
MKQLVLLLALFASLSIVGCSPTETAAPETFSFDAEGNVQLIPPPPGEGFQVELGPWDVPYALDGQQRDYYITMPNEEDFFVGKIEIAMNDGTHHMNFFRTKVELDTNNPMRRMGEIHFTYNGKRTTQQVAYEDSSFYTTSIWNESDLLIEAQVSGKLFTWDLPTLPDGKQTVIHLKPKEPMILQTHYTNFINQKASNNKGKVLVNVWKAKDKGKGFEKSSMMFARNQKIKIPPHSEVSFSKDCLFSAVPRPVYLLGMTGHFHARGKTFTVDKMRIDSVTLKPVVVQENIYVSNSWSEPPFTPFPTPIELGPYEYIRYNCTYVNPTDLTFVFGPKTEVSEHMNLFCWFAPSYLDGSTIYDVTN